MAQTRRSRPLPLHTVDLELTPNEASDLVPLANRAVLRAHGWDVGFWTVLDEEGVEHCVVAVGRRKDGAQAKKAEPDDSAAAGAAGDPEPAGDRWEIVRPSFRVEANEGRTEDAEACAPHDGWIYVFGSHYGSKTGPLEKSRAWLARFREDDFSGPIGEARPELSIALNRFRLHRAVNDALRAFGPETLASGPGVRKSFVKRSRKKAGKRAKTRVNPADTPINVEGAAFRDDGSLLLGLRFPVTAGGHPILVELRGIEAMFEDELAAPVVRRFWVLKGVGSRRRPTGVRALHRRGAELHAITGNLDAVDEDSVLLADHPEGAEATSAHHRFRLPAGRDGGEVEAKLVRRFKEENVEGLAFAGGSFFYVTDEDEHVRVRYPRDGSRS